MIEHRPAGRIVAVANRPGFGVSVARYLKGTVKQELRTRSDEQLVELVLDGHDAAFDVLFDRHVADSLWYAREVLGTWGEAEEAVRHSFAAAHAYLATRGRETEFWPWMQTILGNYCLSMLQARAPGPKQPEGDGTVVDLGEWRLRRRLFGVGLPAVPGAGLREGLMAACGIGTGAAATSAPLMGGTLAKLAVVAVLAGGVGVVSDAVHERTGPAAAGIQASAGQTPDRWSQARGSGESTSGPAARGQRSPVATARKVDSRPRSIRERLAPREGAPTVPAPGDPASGPTGESVPEPQPTPTPAETVPVRGTDSVVQRVADVVKTQSPTTGGSPRVPRSGSLDLSKIGDDPGVSALKPPVDVRALLSRGVSVLPK